MVEMFNSVVYFGNILHFRVNFVFKFLLFCMKFEVVKILKFFFISYEF